MPTSKLTPKLVTVLREGYSRATFVRDLVAGVIVGIVALPLSLAFAIASGVRPEQGLYTAVVAGFLISALSGSRFQIGGPTGAFIVIIYDIVMKHGVDGLAGATFLAGLFLVLMGVARLGNVIKFIPYPVTVGFTSGIALIIFASQLRDLLGLQMQSVPPEFLEKIGEYARHIGTANPYAIAVAAISMAAIIFWPRVSHRIPGPLVAILAGTAVVQLLGWDVETIGSRFGEVPNSFAPPAFPKFSPDTFSELLRPALAIALLAGIESLLSAVVADGMTGTRHRSNMELVGQGIANICSPIFGGIPATGAIARTATNIKNGGRTPIAGMIHALVLLLIMLFFGKWAALIPMASLAAILVVVAYNMSEWHLFVKLFRAPRSDVAILLTTFLLTVLVDLMVAIEVGVVMASLLFMTRMASVTEAGFLREGDVDDEEEGEGESAGARPAGSAAAGAQSAGNAAPAALATRLRSVSRSELPPGVEIFQISGPFFFGAADKFKNAMSRVEKAPRVLILRMRLVSVIDSTGIRILEEFEKNVRSEGTTLVLSGIREQPRAALTKAGFIERAGRINVCDNIDSALARAREIVEQG